jgi:uncharacterized protein YceK
MKIAKKATTGFVLIVLSVASTGCATYRTISEAAPGSPKVFSGTRLDINAIKDNEIGVRKFKVAPPPYPLVDLPFSLLLDALIFPLTFSAATYELILE